MFAVKFQRWAGSRVPRGGGGLSSNRPTLDWFQRPLPREEKFFPLFEWHAAAIASAAESLRGTVDWRGSYFKPLPVQ